MRKVAEKITAHPILLLFFAENIEEGLSFANKKSALKRRLLMLIPGLRHFIVPFTISFAIFVVGCGSGGGSSESNANGESSKVSTDACGVINLPTKLINGQSCDAIERAAVVRVHAMITDGSIVVPFDICTGTMISNNDVLTATHCFLSDNIGGYPIVGYGITIGPENLTRYVEANALSAAPDFRIDNGRLFNDVSILQLSEVPNLPMIPILLSDSPKVGDQGYVYGYGLREEESVSSSFDGTGDFSTLEAGTMTIENITPDHLFVSYSGSGTNVCKGDSGGPLVMPVGGIPAIVGVVSEGSSETCGPGDVTTYINLQDLNLLNWIASVVPDAAAY